MKGVKIQNFAPHAEAICLTFDDGKQVFICRDEKWVVKIAISDPINTTVETVLTLGTDEVGEVLRAPLKVTATGGDYVFPTNPTT